jgi:hypothetical protein
VRDLYNLLEHEFLPLDLASKVQPLLLRISKIGGKLSSASSVPEVKLSQYISALEKLTTLRVLQQVSIKFCYICLYITCKLLYVAIMTSSVSLPFSGLLYFSIHKD